MKIRICILFALLPFLSYSQFQVVKLSYNYDETGNLVSRSIKGARMSSKDDIVSNSSDSIIVYPNPVSKDLNIKIIKKLEKAWSYKIIDLGGKILLEESVLLPEKTIGFESYPNGLFLLILNYDNKKYEYKIVKE